MKKSRNALVKVNYNDSAITGSFDIGKDLSMDVNGVTRMDRLVLIDGKTDEEFELFIYDGKLIIEPYERDEKRDFRINKVIKDENK